MFWIEGNLSGTGLIINHPSVSGAKEVIISALLTRLWLVYVNLLTLVSQPVIKGPINSPTRHVV